MKPTQAQSEAAFREYVTSTAFSITLNKNQTTLLYYLYRYGYAKGNLKWQIHRDTVLAGRKADFVQIVNALIRRGLVQHDWVDARLQPPGWSTEKHQYYFVTRAGKLVAKMLVLAGVVQELQRAKKAA